MSSEAKIREQKAFSSAEREGGGEETKSPFYCSTATQKEKREY